jgi:beta-lactam-binding protein with PASTA domain
MDVQNTITFTTYLLYIAVLVFIFFIWKMFCPSNQQEATEESSSDSDEDKIEQREFTVEELKKFDGKNEQKKVYIAAKGIFLQTKLF